MADVVYLHVGAPKTGTTYLQDRLYANRGALAEHGVHYPVGLLSDMFGPALDLLDRPWGGQRALFHGEWDNLVGRVQRSAGTAIVSHEILAGARADQVSRVRADLEGAELHVVYSARDLARQIPAEWQEGVKHGQRRPFRRFLREVRQAERRDSPLWFWRVQGLPDVLNRWADGLTPERVHLVTVPQAGGERDALWHRYCRAFGVDPAWAPEQAARLNLGIGIDEIAALRRLNTRLGLVGSERGLSWDSYTRLVRQGIVHETLSARTDMRTVVLPPRARDWAAEIAEEWVAWVQQSGIDVVGDVADLRPVFPPPGESWENPDRPDERRVADALLDALVASLRESDRRPDPERSTVARLGRAARRLRGQ